jgi:hypothetical protein
VDEGKMSAERKSTVFVSSLREKRQRIQRKRQGETLGALYLQDNKNL